MIDLSKKSSEKIHSVLENLNKGDVVYWFDSDKNGVVSPHNYFVVSGYKNSFILGNRFSLDSCSDMMSLKCFKKGDFLAYDISEKIGIDFSNKSFSEKEEIISSLNSGSLIKRISLKDHRVFVYSYMQNKILKGLDSGSRSKEALDLGLILKKDLRVVKWNDILLQ